MNRGYIRERVSFLHSQASALLEKKHDALRNGAALSEHENRWEMVLRGYSSLSRRDGSDTTVPTDHSIFRSRSHRSSSVQRPEAGFEAWDRPFFRFQAFC